MTFDTEPDPAVLAEAIERGIGVMNGIVAIEHGHDIRIDGQLDTGGWWADCTCGRYFSTQWFDVTSLVQSWLSDHVAEAMGICWKCGEVDDRTNRLSCRRCELMWWADHDVVPRDVEDAADTHPDLYTKFMEVDDDS